MKNSYSLLAFLAFAASTQLHAASGSWNTTATGLWSGASNWASSTIADGATFTATFNQNLTAGTTVNLDSSRTIGNLVFNDPTTGFFAWTLANNGNSANILTLANSASKPAITVNTSNTVAGAIISAELQGTNGFQKLGNGTLTVSGNNSSLSGQVNLTNGTILVGNSNALGSGTINIALAGTGSGTNFTKLLLTNGITLANNITVNANYGNAGPVIGVDTGTSSATISGNITINSANLSGGTIYGTGGTGLLTITGQINSALPSGTSNAIVVRQGGIRFSGGGSYNDIELRGGGTNINYSIGADNGIATNANVILGGNGNINLDLNGFNQSVNGLTDFSTGNARAITNSVAGTKTLTLTNSLNHTFGVTGAGAGTISGNLALNVSLASGITQTISSANSYNGGTTVNSGRLITTSTTLGTGGLTINNGGIYAYQPTVAQGLSLGGGSLTLASGSTLGASVGGTVSQSAIAAGTASAAGSVNLNIYGIPGVAVTTGTHNLVTATSGLTAGGATYTPRIYNASNFTATGFSATDTALSMSFTSATALTTEYWKGGLSGGSGVWALSDGSTASNWATDLAGTATSLTPGTTADLIFSSTGATNQGAMTLGANMSVKSLTFNDSATTTLAADGNTLTLNTTGGITVGSGAGAVTLNTPITMGGAQTWTNNSGNLLSIGGFITTGSSALTVTGTGNTTISGVVGGIGFPPSAALTKSGTGTLTLSGNNIYQGATTVSAGKLIVSGAINTTNITGTAQMVIGNVANSNSVLQIAGGTVNATFATAPSIAIGSVASSIGSLQMTSGTLNTSSELHIGRGAGSYAAYSQSGGAATVGSYLVVGFNNDRAVLNLSGGSLTVASNVMTVGAGGTGSIAVANLSGGAFTSAGGAFIGENGLGTLNVSGSSIVTLGGNGINIGRNTNSTGIVNLGGGTLNTNLVNKGTGTATFNFNGGTLQANTSSTTFMTGLSNTYVNSGGALIDTNGNDITIGQALLAPIASGLTNTGLTASGSGYIDTPLVTITGGGGTGATAVANLDGSGNVTGITITNPGINYTGSPAFALVGGGGTGSITGATTPVANVSGGLTKSGAGILTLTGSSNFSGDINVNAGTLIANLGNNVLNPTNSALGNNQVSRNITLSGSSTLQFNSGDTMGSATSTIASKLVIGSGSTVTNGGGVFNRIGSVELNGGTLTAASGAVVGYQAYSFDSSAVVTVGGSTVSTISSAGANGGIHLNTSTSFVVADATGNAASDLNVSAPLINRNATEGGAGGLAKSGAGTMTLTGVNTYTGTTTISNGTLALGVGGSIANTSTIDVKSGATLDASAQSGWSLATGQTLKGNGTVDVGGANVFTVGGGASLAPGASPGTLAVTGTLSFAALSTFSAEIAPSTPASDLVNVSGGLNIDATASLALSLFGTDTALAEGTKFTLIDYSGAWNNVAFAGLADDTSAVLGMNTYMVDYNDPTLGGTALTLTVIPEPTTATLIGGLGVLGLLRRRRNNG